MDTRILYYLLCVAEEKNISNAAKKLFITQPTLSQHIHKFEKALGVHIFDRTTTPLSLTYSGEKFVKFASKVLEAEKVFLEEISDINKFRKGRLIIGISSTHGASLLPSILPQFKELFPGIEVILVEDNSFNLEKMLEKHKADIIIANLPIQNKNIVYETLSIDEVILVIPKNFLPNRIELNPTMCNNPINDEIDILELKDYPFLLLKPGHKIRQIVNTIFQENNINPKILLESVSINTLYNLASTGMGITFIPKSLIPYKDLQSSTALYFSTLRNSDANYCMVAAYNKHSHMPITVRSLVNLLKNI